MKKYIISVLLLSAGFSFASAQTSDVDTSNDNSCAIISSNLRYLSRDANGSTDVSILQDFLNGRGYLKSQPTGFFGSATRRAVIAFQNDNGLRATPPGYVGPGTRAKIKELDCNDTSAVNTTPATAPVTYNNTPTYTAPTTQVTNNTYQYQKPATVTTSQASPVAMISSVNGKGGFGTGDSNYILGQYFSNAKEVYLTASNGAKISLTFTVSSDTRIDVPVPSLAGGYYTLYVVNATGAISSPYNVGYLGAMQ